MTIKGVRYDVRTGRILGIREGAVKDIRLEPYAFVEGNGHWDTHYVDVERRKIVPRPEMQILQGKAQILANGEDFVVFRGFPAGTQIRIGGAVHTVNDGVFEFATTLPGEYLATFELWPYLPMEVTVIAE